MLVRETIPFGAMLCLDFKCQQVYGLGTCRAAVLGGSFLLPEVPSPWAACCTASTTRSFVVRLLLKFPDSDEEGIAQMLLPKFQDFFSHCLWAHRLEKGKTGLFSRKGKFQSNGSSNNKEWGRERWGLSAAAAALSAPSSPERGVVQGASSCSGSSKRRYIQQQLATCASVLPLSHHSPITSEVWWHYYCKCQCELSYPSN